jgi:hypothetical protein
MLSYLYYPNGREIKTGAKKIKNGWHSLRLEGNAYHEASLNAGRAKVGKKS